ncbi:MAG: DUF4388 domain-containing protein [Candidatus Schekmanbacteria bacterium]|nr:DUF4388 domain-containing protein [Candidatus Schekmanbacteria bacterium]
MGLQGDLETISFASVIDSLARDEKSGVLKLEQGGVERRLFLQRGKLVHAESTNKAERLAKVLLRRGICDARSLEQAKREARHAAKGFVEILVANGCLTWEKAAEARRACLEDIVFGAIRHRDAGAFSFDEGLIADGAWDSGAPIRVDIPFLLMEMARREDEMKRVSGGRLQGSTCLVTGDLEFRINLVRLLASDAPDGSEEGRAAQLAEGLEAMRSRLQSDNPGRRMTSAAVLRYILSRALDRVQ